ncbi:MAG: tRNA 2-thiouridine(34) synthase MnmA [Deltaproteobacteria bacterium]|nr:tRNA 2-thiouridine(34) synthase MnmA [Deltaproteobacteria bacterium]
MRVVVGMSGGVDSSVAALILKKEGHEVIGVTMKLWDCFKTAARQSCCSTADSIDALRVCEQIGIRHHVVDMRPAFKKEVVEYFVNEYSSGRTPNPCIKCNEALKFNLLRNKTLELFGTDLIATGHYEKIQKNDGGNFSLLKGVDSNKDQSYFLFTLTPEQLAKTIFPVGCLAKAEVRKMAMNAGLKTAEKSESQEICFIPDNDYAGFIAGFYPEAAKPAGDFVDKSGHIVGRHAGAHSYTIGQRRGLGFGVGKRQYVTAIAADKNEIALGSNEDLMKKEAFVNNVAWINEFPKCDFKLSVKIRYKHSGADAAIELLDNNRAKIIFENPQRALTPGQAAVFYNGDEVIGGGWIE